MLLKADTDRRRKMKQEDDEAREAREAFQKKCQERAESLRGLIGALVAYEDGGGRYGYLRAVHFTGNECAVERIMPLGCARTEVTTLPCALVDAVDHSQGRPRKVWANDYYDKPKEPKPAKVKEPKEPKAPKEPKLVVKSAGAQPAPGVYVCTRRGTNARLSISPEGFKTLLKGSLVATEAGPSCPNPVAAKRNELLKDGGLVPAGTVLQLVEDLIVTSTSAAAAFVLGTSASGPAEWKVGSGRCRPSL